MTNRKQNEIAIVKRNDPRVARLPTVPPYDRTPARLRTSIQHDPTTSGREIVRETTTEEIETALNIHQLVHTDYG